LFGAGPPRALFGHTWTLCYEEQFYFVAGVLLLVMPRRFFAGAVAITLLVLGLYVAPWTDKQKALAGFFLDGSWLMFAAGILVYFMVNRFANRVQVGAAYAVIVAGIVVTAANSWRQWPASRDFELFVALSFALAISLLHRWDQLVISTKALWPVTLCGQMCYSLYLVHYPVVRAASHYLYNLGANDARSTLLITVPISMTLSILAGAVFYFTVERFFVNSHNIRACEARSPATELVAVPCVAYEEPMRS
jgi:peptidoglycan/LPS O-acetylase OafA/YrhL